MSRYLITGGAGFLGINLCRYLLARGHDVTSLDIADFNYPERAEVCAIKGDIRDRATVAKAMAGVDYGVHAAAALPLYPADEIYSTDVTGTRIVIDAAYEQGVKRFVHLSTTAVYGINARVPGGEDDPRIAVGPYGDAKIQAEDICFEYRERGMIAPLLRPKAFVGPERLGIFAMLFDWARDGRGFPVLGDGENLYQLLDVEDLCEVIEACCRLDAAVVNDTFNIGAKKFTTMAEDYQAVLDYAGFGKKVTPIPAEPAIFLLRALESLNLSPVYKWVYETAAADSVVSIERAEEKLGFQPKFSNIDALLRNYQWYLDHIDSISKQSGVSHRAPWRQGILSLAKLFF